MQDKVEAAKVIEDIVKRIEQVMHVVNLFEDSRPTEKSLTKLEEAIMWMNVMVHHVELRKQAVQEVAEVPAA